MKAGLATSVRLAATEERVLSPERVVLGVLSGSAPALLFVGAATGSPTSTLLGSLLAIGIAPWLGVATGRESPFLRMRTVRIAGSGLASATLGGVLVATGVGSPTALLGVVASLLLYAGATATWGLPLSGCLPAATVSLLVTGAFMPALNASGSLTSTDAFFLGPPAALGLAGILIVLFGLPEKILVERMRRRVEAGGGS